MPEKQVILIFDEADNIHYASVSLRNFLNLAQTELSSKKITELIQDEPEKASLVELKKLSFSSPQELRLKLLSKEGKIYPLQGILEGFEFFGKPVYLFYGNGTYQFYDQLVKVLMEVNKIVLRARSEEEILEGICKQLVEDLDFRMVWVGIPDPKEGVVKPIYWYGYEEGYLSEIKISLDPTSKEGQGPTAKALRSGKIVINPDTRTNPDFVAFRDKALKRGYLSSCAIPIFHGGKLKYLLNLYVKEPEFFKEEISEFMHFIKESIEYALDKIEKEYTYNLMSAALEESDLMLFIVNTRGEIIHVNTMIEVYLGYAQDEILGKNVFEIMEFNEGTPFIHSLSELTMRQGIYTFRKKNGELSYVNLKILPISRSKKSMDFLLLGRDITFERDLLESLENIREYDSLTGLHTLYGLTKRYEEFLRKSTHFAMLVDLDLYDFSSMNDFFGVKKGDALLKLVADRLKELFGKEAYLARVSSDEFLILFADLADFLEIDEKVIRVTGAFSIPFEVDGDKITLKYNLGISVYPKDGKDLEELYRRANSALIFAKKEGPNVFKFYNPELGAQIRKTLNIERLLEEALERGYFQFYFQPYFNTSDLTLAGAEALIRIVKPEGEVISPAYFIEHLERSPLRESFETWAVKQIAEYVNKWKISIGLNLYAETYTNETFWKWVDNFLAQLSAPLVLEITERAFIKNPSKTLEIIQKLKAKYPYIKLAVDDLGTGYSNFEYLVNLPIDLVKIDLSLVKVIDRDERKRKVVKTIIDLAHMLSAKALAEGVENYEIANILDIMGCDYLQGFYFDKPLPAPEFEKKYIIG